MKKSFLVLSVLIGCAARAIAQSYHAAYGSNYTSSINITNNPASAVTSPFKWDLTLFGTQLKSAGNVFIPSPSGFNPVNSIKPGAFARKADFNFNTNVLNARISLSSTRAIAFGANVRGYTRLRISSFNYADTLTDITNFFLINPNVTSYNAKLTSSSWVELFGTYSQTIIDNGLDRINAGVTMKLSRGISGGFARVQNVNITQTAHTGGGVDYQLVSGGAAYGYSSNYDPWINDSTQTFKNFLKTSQAGISFDFGLEYIIRPQGVHTFYDEDESDYDYDWKIGLSLMDVGFNRYRYGLKSFQAVNPKANITNTVLEQKFSSVSGMEEFRDSLSTLVNYAAGLGGIFTVINPMRMILNVDRPLGKNFYINGEASINLSPLAGDQRFYVQELNFITVTPRWETRNLGAYLPVQYNNAGKFWIGAAIKAGPLLAGVHNLSTAFSKERIQNGGGYVAIILHPWKKGEGRQHHQWDCPKN